jgi:hypothetical protein
MLFNFTHFLNCALRLLVIVTTGFTLNACSPKCMTGRKLEGGVCVSAAGSRDAGEERGPGLTASDTQMMPGELDSGVSGGAGAVAGKSAGTSGNASLPDPTRVPRPQTFQVALPGRQALRASK